MAGAVRDALIGMGLLQPLLGDPSITDIAITGTTVWVTRTDGTKHQAPPVTSSSDELVALVRDVAARAGADEPPLRPRSAPGTRLGVAAVTTSREGPLRAGAGEICGGR